MPDHATTRRGITIMESVLVLAVVGIIIGAIWAGYKGLNTQTKITNGTRQVTMLLKATRAYLSNQNESNMAVAGGSNYNDLLAYGTSSPKDPTKGSIPSDIKIIAGTGGGQPTLQTDLGTVNVRLYDMRAVAGAANFNSPRIVFTFNSFTRGTCVSMIQAMAGNAAVIQNLGLVGIQMINTYVPANDFNDNNLLSNTNAPDGFVTVETARSKCNSNTNNVSLSFNLRG